MYFRMFLYALLAAAFFGIATPFSKALLADLQSNQLAGLLYLGAGISTLPWVMYRRKSNKTIFPRDRRNQRNLLGAVIFGGIVGPVLLLIGLKHALAASVSMWLNLEAVATAILALLIFREHIGRWTWIANAGVVCAGLLLSYDAGWSGWIGLLCVTGAAIAWGLDNNFTAIIDGISPSDSTFWKGMIAGTTNLLIGLTFFPWQIGVSWLYALLLGTFAYGLSVTLYIRSAQGLGATRAQMVFSTAPFFGVLFSVAWLGESFSLLQGVAAGIIVICIVLLFRDRHEHTHRHEALTHEHEHKHGAHHNHEHESRVVGSHAHEHSHEPLEHRHPHWPDLHHRHLH